MLLLPLSTSSYRPSSPGSGAARNTAAASTTCPDFTHVPLPIPMSSRPSPTSCPYAVCTVPLLIPRYSASLESDGRRVPGGRLPSAIRLRNTSASRHGRAICLLPLSTSSYRPSSPGSGAARNTAAASTTCPDFTHVPLPIRLSSRPSLISRSYAVCTVC